MKLSEEINKMLNIIKHHEDLDLGSIKTIGLINTKVKELEAQLESLKLCANCKHYDSENYCVRIANSVRPTLYNSVCESWEIES